MRRRPRRIAPRAVTVPLGTSASIANHLLGIEEGAPIEFDLDAIRPRMRGECAHGARPCPFVGCRFNLFLDVNAETGSIKLNHPGVDLADMTETCALDIAERGGLTLEEVGTLMNLTRERTRQIETRALVLANAIPLIAELRSA